MKFYSTLGVLWVALCVVHGDGSVRQDQDVLEEENSYEGYQVLSIIPEEESHLQILKKLNNELKLDFWSFRPTANKENVFSVSPKSLDTVRGILKEENISYTTIIENLQRSIYREHAAQQEAIRREGDLGGRATFERYMTYEQIVNNAQDLAKRHEDRVRIDTIGQTYEGRKIISVRLSSSFGLPTPTVVVEAGAHAREWISPATAVFLINQIADDDSVAHELLNNLNWHIIPVLNPDGYEYTHNNPKQRLWRKNRYRVAKCYGVDLNRNFGYHWKEAGASTSPCDDTYVGAEAFSEPETRGLKDYIVKEAAVIKLYLSLHSYGFGITYPWAFTSSRPADANEMQCIGEKANEAMVKAGSRKNYTVGTSSDVLGAASGVSADWVKGEAKINKAFTLTLPDGGPNNYDVPPPEIERIAKQLLQGLKVFAKYATTACHTAGEC